MWLVWTAVLLRVYVSCDGVTTTGIATQIDLLTEKLRKNNDEFKQSMSKMNGLFGGVEGHRRALGVDPELPPPAPKKYAGGEPAPAAVGAAPGPGAVVDAVRNPKYVDKSGVIAGGDLEKAEKLRHFLDRYKTMVGAFMANRSDASTAHALTRVRLRARDEMITAKEASAGALRTDQTKSPIGARAPNALELDMAPARGGPVHTLRNKNHLCHRHVLIPEGPKYDSRGKQYMGEFKMIRDRDYPRTSAPKMLLPKCCNCCRKSVLGCE